MFGNKTNFLLKVSFFLIFPLVANASMIEVAKCKIKVTSTVKDLKEREIAKKKCYDLYPKSIRQSMYESDINPIRFNEFLIRVEIGVQRERYLMRNRDRQVYRQSSQSFPALNQKENLAD